MLTVEGFSVPILPGTRVTHVPHGDTARAYSGRLRTDRRALHRVVQVRGSYFDSTDTVALRAILNTPGPVLCGGTLIGDDAYFHVSGLDIQPIRSDLFSFSFQLEETVDQPSVLLFSLDGDAFGEYTFTRSGTVGPYTDEDGVLQSAAANVARREWLWLDGSYVGAPDTPSLLIEAARTNLVDSDTLTSWTTSGTPVVTGSVSDPAGGTGAYTVEDDDGAAAEYILRNVTFTGDAVKAVVFVVKEGTMPGSGVQRLALVDTSAGSSRLDLDISAWSAGVPTVSASTGTYLGKRYAGDGWWVLYARSTSVTAANTNRIEIIPAQTAGQTGAIDVYRVNAYDSVDPPWSILDASETLNNETWYATYSHVPQAHTGYVKLVDPMHPGSTWSANHRVLQIGNAGGTGYQLIVHRESGSDSYRVVWSDGSTSVASTVDLNPTWGDGIELIWWQFSDGSVQIAGSNDGAAQVTGTQSSAQALSAYYGAGEAAAERLYLNHSAARGHTLYRNLKIAAGSSYTLAEMRDIAKGRLHPRQVLPL